MLDAEHVLPARLIADDFGKDELGLVPTPEELDHLLDLGTNDSPHDHRELRVVQVEARVYWPNVPCPLLSLAGPLRAAVRFNDVSLDTAVQSLPTGEAHVQLPSRLGLTRSAWNEDLELMRTTLLSEETRAPQELLEISEQRLIADVDVHCRRHAPERRNGAISHSRPGRSPRLLAESAVSVAPTNEHFAGTFKATSIEQLGQRAGRSGFALTPQCREGS
jgi:hypothetical protein